jgi:hypothetical protein
MVAVRACDIDHDTSSPSSAITWWALISPVVVPVPVERPIEQTPLWTLPLLHVQ